ncbi:putative disease resistance protein RGA3 [Ziziphus jujuba]|uniref:Disease resistance protein RGA3 n=1 Tax=Ziziphus jujuba TaxID=326968 RepID=A0ABM4A8T0_ZIZJJ|nr:putative disease resistance protein RGA3 [Ziziphus jujuba]XP_060673110.1 putative disease resistance protein RGA3 [Ziziphus jujuba]XP_060673111.1 putative disease resistance protein RGA3 [Ziziphus jujuba]XP_060673112.1 putative disease resistance protein RGA3 [Ziziphus jujuba]XP_060673113.1 putative disease resistance protein RGA3 [Ziziphus jujuba]XP_060673114.1 putative disease resistance protein RGA3 [Ziziphus jujuba]XP_060673115.1 putative disease resistance protein RGA3 [Ziziphus jujub
MADTILFDIVGEIILNLGSSALKEIGSLWGVKNDLRKLNQTMSVVEAKLLDAEEKQTRSHEVSVWLEKLQDIVFDADDLVDEFHTEDLRRRVMPGNKMRKQVCIFFSSSNQLVFRLKMSHKIKEIRGSLGEIKDDATFPSLETRHEEKELVSPNVRETHSYVREEEVVGRDDDRRAIIKHLVDVETSESVSFIAIVGIGGLGKTTLAQLVYNDDKVQKHFDLRMWVCVSDVFDLKSIVGNIVRSPTNASLDQLKDKLKKKIDGQKYFLVLDDVWNEDSTKWESLRSLLMGGARGSRVLVTTRSKKVAEVTRPMLPYTLEGLDQDKSWSLFEKQAFGQRPDFEKSDFVALGKEIVDKCRGVPLAIKSIGSILYFKKSKAEWLLFKDNELAEAIQQEDNNIIPTLKLSYNHLPSYLKRCFSYCSLFPKDYKYDVQELIKLWMAQGLIKSNRNQCPEDIGYGYFLDLLWRSFFQEAKEDEWGNLVCKMHDLMHDLAISVAGTRSVLIDKDSIKFSENLVHVSFDIPLDKDSIKFIENLVHVSFDIPLDGSAILKTLSPLLKHNYKLRTLFCVPEFHLPEFRFNFESNVAVTNLKEICSEFKSLRALGLQKISKMQKLPKNLGALKHLRYLDLSLFVEIQELPNSITKLQNLQTLNLRRCKKLSSLPRDMHKMVSLRHLVLDGCDRLSHMPSRLGELSCVQTLDRFVVGAKQSRRKNTSIGEVGELRTLNSLRGVLRIENLRPDIEKSENPNLQQKQHLRQLVLKFDRELDDDIFVEKYEKSLELLQPHANLKWLVVTNYMGVGFASWVMSLVNLVKLKLIGCVKCRYLPPLHVLPCLQQLSLLFLDSLECIGVDQNATATSSSSSCDMPFFPSLKKLWIKECPKLTSMPLFPFLEKLVLKNTSSKPLLQTLTMTMAMAQKEASSSSTSSASSSSSFQSLSKLESMGIRSIDDIQSLLQQAAVMCNLSSLRSLNIGDCPNLTSLPEAMGNLSSLRYLHIDGCPNLTSLPEAMGNLSSLQYLFIGGCSNLTSLPEAMFNLSSLQNLHIGGCSNLTSLPEAMGNLSSLQDLYIRGCSNLTSLPEAMGNLSSLQSLDIMACPNLTSLPEAMGNLSSLQSLDIMACPNLTTLPEAMGNLSSLQSLRIVDCPNLTSLPEAMGNLSSLQSLRIVDCPNLTSLPEAMGSLSSLQSLRIVDCPNLTSLPEAMGNLSSLQSLSIEGCSCLTSLPEGQMFRTLTFLGISQCPVLQQRYNKTSPMIAHIPNLEIY